MVTYSSRRTSGPVLHRPISPGAARSSAPFASFTTAVFSSSTQSPPSFRDHHNRSHSRSASPTRINLIRPATAVRSQVLSGRPSTSSSPAVSRKSCMCSPTTHPGSFRCSLHKGFQIDRRSHRTQAVSSPSTRLNMRRSAMTNSLVRIGTVEGDLVRRALAALIRPSSHQQRRREGFQPRPSRLSVMSKAGEYRS